MRSMEENPRYEEFSLLGGTPHRLGERFHVVRGGTNIIAPGLVLGANA
jgi:hypothetical protein